MRVIQTALTLNWKGLRLENQMLYESEGVSCSVFTHNKLVLSLGLGLDCIICCCCAQLCPTLCVSMDCSPSGSSARILEWIAIPFFRGFPQSRPQTRISCIAGRFFTVWATKHEWKKSILDHEINNMDISIFPHSLALFSGHVKMCVHVSNLHRHKFYIYRPCIILCLRSLGK